MIFAYDYDSFELFCACLRKLRKLRKTHFLMHEYNLYVCRLLFVSMMFMRGKYIVYHSYTTGILQPYCNHTTTIFLLLLLSVCCSIVVRLLSVHLTDNKRTSNVLQTNIQPCCSMVTVWLQYGSYNELVVKSWELGVWNSYLQFLT